MRNGPPNQRVVNNPGERMRKVIQLQPNPRKKVAREYNRIVIKNL